MATCSICNTSNLKWEQSGGKWQLSKHKCTPDIISSRGRKVIDSGRFNKVAGVLLTNYGLENGLLKELGICT